MVERELLSTKEHIIQYAGALQVTDCHASIEHSNQLVIVVSASLCC
jgi:hypothetical protein